MAYGENPGVVLSIETTLTYDSTKDFGHASAGKDLMLSLVTSGANAGKAQLGADGVKPLGKFMSLDKDKVATYLATGTPMICRRGTAAVTPGSKIVCAGSGKIKDAPENSVAANAEGRGQVIKQLEDADNARVLVLFP